MTNTDVDYIANRLAQGEFPGNAKHIFSKEDWLKFKKELDHHYAKEFLEMLPEKIIEDITFNPPKKGIAKIYKDGPMADAYNLALSDIKQTIKKRYLEGEE